MKAMLRQRLSSLDVSLIKHAMPASRRERVVASLIGKDLQSSVVRLASRHYSLCRSVKDVISLLSRFLLILQWTRL